MSSLATGIQSADAMDKASHGNSNNSNNNNTVSIDFLNFIRYMSFVYSSDISLRLKFFYAVSLSDPNDKLAVYENIVTSIGEARNNLNNNNNNNNNTSKRDVKPAHNETANQVAKSTFYLSSNSSNQKKIETDESDDDNADQITLGAMKKLSVDDVDDEVLVNVQQQQQQQQEQEQEQSQQPQLTSSMKSSLPLMNQVSLFTFG